MLHCFKSWLLLLALSFLALSMPHSQAFLEDGNGMKSAVFLSPMFVLRPGSVENRYYYNIDFPRGHIALKSFNAEVIDEAGNPVPLQETYLHHWVVAKYYQLADMKDSEDPEYNANQGLHQLYHNLSRNSGICQNNVLGQQFGLGSETRRTATDIPDPYGIEIGNPAEIPEGYEERWLLNVHAIDTRGVEDTLGCTECRCDLYNVTIDEYSRPLRPGYRGGLHCCYDQTQCRLKEGFEGARRTLYLRYTVKWVDWHNLIMPVKIYIFDVTDTWNRLDDSTRHTAEHECHVEYDVESCSTTDGGENGCIDIKRTSLTMPTGGYIIYGVAHQHSGGIGSTLYGEDGRVICSSIATYGEGKEAGNEAGYIVGMSTCYPQLGLVKIFDGETLTLESNYSSTQMHTGVMGLFYILVADQLPKKHTHFVRTAVQSGENEIVKFSTVVWAVALLAVAMAVAAGVRYRPRNEREDGYQSIVS